MAAKYLAFENGILLRKLHSNIINRGNIHKGLHVVSTYDVKNALTLYQKPSDNNGKERELVRNIISTMALKDCAGHHGCPSLPDIIPARVFTEYVEKSTNHKVRTFAG